MLSQESRTALKAAYEGAQPFPHSAIHDLCDPQLLRQVCDPLRDCRQPLLWNHHHSCRLRLLLLLSHQPLQNTWRCIIQSVCGLTCAAPHPQSSCTSASSLRLWPPTLLPFCFTLTGAG